MTSRSGLGVLVLIIVLLIGMTLIVASIKPPPITNTNAAAILALVTAGAFAIERLIEICWTVVGSTLGHSWPLKPIGDRLNTFIDRLNGPLNDFYTQAEPLIGKGSDATAELQKWLADDKKYYESLEEQIRNLQQLEPGNPRARQIANVASRAVIGLQKHHKGLARTAEKANKSLASVDKFVKTFEDNPARRTMSLLAGATLGLLVASILGLDAIQAVYNGMPETGWAKALYANFAGIGVAVTGLVMGAGASPTHELIKALKSSKESNKRAAHKV